MIGPAAFLLSSVALGVFLVLLARVVRKRVREEGVTMGLSNGPDPAAAEGPTDDQAARGG